MNSIFDIRPTINLVQEMAKIESIVSANIITLPEVSAEPISFKRMVDEIIVFWEYRGTAGSHDEFLSVRGIKLQDVIIDRDAYAHLQFYYVLIKSLSNNISFDDNMLTKDIYKNNERVLQDLMLHIDAILVAQNVSVVNRPGSELVDFVLNS